MGYGITTGIWDLVFHAQYPKPVRESLSATSADAWGMDLSMSDSLNNLQQDLAKSPVLFQRRARTVSGINISGKHVLGAFLLALGLAGPLLWAFVRYWLFGP